ncbi:MAG: hypothetical protein LBV43_01805 [Prevotella sp.]|jgi:hypothetical protein|nr:hypothetical protein [Prevotella sp.]
MDKEVLLKKLEEARIKYKPEKVKAIFIAEAPPDSLNRFFYYENVKEKDYLFLGIIDILYPGLKDIYIKKYKRHPEVKKSILNQIKKNGYYLLDLFELPISINSESKINSIKKLSGKLSKICDKETPIILIKVNVYDTIYHILKAKFNIINKRIDFPSTGNQQKFKKSFAEAMNEITSK